MRIIFFSNLDAFTCMIKNFIICFMTTTWMVYFAAGIGFLDSTTTTVLRSMIISVVPVSEIGKEFSVVEFFKGVLRLVGPVIYGKLYEFTVRTVPQAFLYLSSTCKVLVFLTSMMVYYQLNKREKRLKMDKYIHKKNDDKSTFDKTDEPKEKLKIIENSD